MYGVIENPEKPALVSALFETRLEAYNAKFDMEERTGKRLGLLLFTPVPETFVEAEGGRPLHLLPQSGADTMCFAAQPVYYNPEIGCVLADGRTVEGMAGAERYGRFVRDIQDKLNEILERRKDRADRSI